MWAYYTAIAYFVLALLVPVVWALASVYRRTRGARAVVCPADQQPTFIELDAAHAVRMHILGNPEARVKACGKWPASSDCVRDCLANMHRAA